LLGARSVSEYDVLCFWRDVEIFNLPSAPKIARDKRQVTAPFQKGDLLPWQQGYDSLPRPSESEEWVHAIFLAVAPAKTWAQVILDEISPSRRLNRTDMERISGESWLAAFMVDSLGKAAGDTYVLASFSLGIQRLRNNETLNDLNSDIQESIQGFIKRRTLSTDIASLDIEKAPEDELADEKQTASSHPDSVKSQNTTELEAISNSISWYDLDEELKQALEPFPRQVKEQQYRVLIKSSLRKRRAAKEESSVSPDVDFLNSFYLDDLDQLISIAGSNKKWPLGTALSRYLGPESSVEKRRDILSQASAMAECISSLKLTSGRWPEKVRHHLYLAQQAAVGEISFQLSATAGLMAVNGPPGTGKTTLLRDVVAEVVVKRAKGLAELDHPWQLFEGKIYVGGKPFNPLKPQIAAGTGIVVASNNNAAVENITLELPVRDKISQDEFPDASYFQEVATKIFQKANIDKPAWGLIAARLGNRENCYKFFDAFYQDYAATPNSGEPCDIKSLLEAQPDQGTEEPWKEAKEEFLQLFSKVEVFRQKCVEIEQALQQLSQLSSQIELAQPEIELVQQELSSLYARLRQLEIDAQSAVEISRAATIEANNMMLRAELAAQGATDRLKIAEAETAPRFWDRCLKAIGFQTKRMRSWERATLSARTARAEANDALRRTLSQKDNADREYSRCTRNLETLKFQQQQEVSRLNHRLQSAERQIDESKKRTHQLESKIEALRQTVGVVPDNKFFALSFQEQHRGSAWVSPEFEELRSKLFLAALRLHETTLKACKTKAIPNLRLVKAMLAGNTPEPILPEHRSLVWDMLFFTVPVVSSSLASFSRLFGGLERESLGWLLIDEAGQATPQSVAGAIWRSKRVVVIGDPMQVEPVVTVPSAVIMELRKRNNVDVSWSPLTESAQTISDRTMTLGAYIGRDRQSKEAKWTGLPLRAHRRCIDPMFEVSNDIAYDGQMVQANTRPEEISCVLGESTWFDIRGISSDRQVVNEELRCLASTLRLLKRAWPMYGDHKPANIYMISPFRKVASACRDVIRKEGPFPGGRRIACGTVHTFQGKEAEVVILVLGSSPGRAGRGSRAWAAWKPNLLNVAVTRAKLRLYVIGNAEDWGQCSSFDVLLQHYQENGQVLEPRLVLG
jgi:AAA domain